MSTILRTFQFGLLVLLLVVNSGYAQVSAEKAAADEWIKANESSLKDINQRIWSLAELGLQEHKSSKILQDLLSANGFKVKRGVADMPTAFVASYGTGKPVIAILAEYDALPGVSQQWLGLMQSTAMRAAILFLAPPVPPLLLLPDTRWRSTACQAPFDCTAVPQRRPLSERSI